jgi:ribosome-associated heat shock protein Hsp15
MDNEELRIDKWLWCARLFKTRTMAADACKGGKVKGDSVSMKPAHDVKPGEVISVQLGQLHKVVEVVSIPKSRVSPKDVPNIYKDVTPAEEYERIEFMHAYKVEYRDRGAGRPTKKDRRILDKLKREE